MAVYKSTRSIGDYTGIHLAEETDPEKAFSPTKMGIILGITYSVSDFTWRLAPSKVDKLANLLFDVLENDSLPNGVLKTLLGKMNHYGLLVHLRCRCESATTTLPGPITRSRPFDPACCVEQLSVLLPA